jgi:hypothetical protein
MRWCVLLVVAACTSSRIGPGVILGPNWQAARRDPDLTRPLVEPPMPNPWRSETASLSTPPEPDPPRGKAYYAASAIAVLVGGFIPMIVWSGTFDENRIAPQPDTEDGASEAETASE